jgi:NADH:ubiquinone oxidoreductase subunit D
MLRSVGVNHDLRKKFPYEQYARFSFSIPIGRQGDCFDRYFIRMEEMRQSVFLIEQVLNLMPTGAVVEDEHKFFSSTRQNIKNSMESVIHHFKFFSQGVTVPNNEIYCSTEAPKGEFGVYLVTNNTARPYRCKIKSPGFLHLQGLNTMVKNHYLADVVTIIGTQDIVFGEIDR